MFCIRNANFDVIVKKLSFAMLIFLTKNDTEKHQGENRSNLGIYLCLEDILISPVLF